LDSEAAYGSTSFGAFQIIGMDAQRLGFSSAGEYARFVAQSEQNQFEALFLFAAKTRIPDALRAHDWKAFARAFNGAGNSNEYARRFAEAYQHQLALLGQHAPWNVLMIPATGDGSATLMLCSEPLSTSVAVDLPRERCAASSRSSPILRAIH
jgi:hypothetical protein